MKSLHIDADWLHDLHADQPQQYERLRDLLQQYGFQDVGLSFQGHSTWVRQHAFGAPGPQPAAGSCQLPGHSQAAAPSSSTPQQHQGTAPAPAQTADAAHSHAPALQADPWTACSGAGCDSILLSLPTPPNIVMSLSQPINTKVESLARFVTSQANVSRGIEAHQARIHFGDCQELQFGFPFKVDYEMAATLEVCCHGAQEYCVKVTELEATALSQGAHLRVHSVRLQCMLLFSTSGTVDSTIECDQEVGCSATVDPHELTAADDIYQVAARGGAELGFKGSDALPVVAKVTRVAQAAHNRPGTRFALQTDKLLGSAMLTKGWVMYRSMAATAREPPESTLSFSAAQGYVDSTTYSMIMKSGKDSCRPHALLVYMDVSAVYEQSLRETWWHGKKVQAISAWREFWAGSALGGGWTLLKLG